MSDAVQLTDEERIDYHRGVAERALAAQHDIAWQRNEALIAKDGAYHERNQCVSLIARMALSLGYKVGFAKTAIPGWDEEWHGCVYIDLPTGQVSWHYHDSDAWLFNGFPPYEAAWDGHSTSEKYARVNAAFQTEARAVLNSEDSPNA